jgi:hypothetical protein
VKLAEFNALCVQEWAQEPRGDVKVLSLTDASYEELSADVGGERDPAKIKELHDALSRLATDPAYRQKVLILPPGPLELVNPVTRSAVKITGGADADTAEVYSVPESRVVTCN